MFSFLEPVCTSSSTRPLVMEIFSLTSDVHVSSSPVPPSKKHIHTGDVQAFHKSSSSRYYLHRYQSDSLWHSVLVCDTRSILQSSCLATLTGPLVTYSWFHDYRPVYRPAITLSKNINLLHLVLFLFCRPSYVHTPFSQHLSLTFSQHSSNWNKKTITSSKRTLKQWINRASIEQSVEQ